MCPEVELGLGTPRETLRLERQAGESRLVSPKTREDLTERMRAYSSDSASIGWRADRPLRLRAQEGFAELRHGAGQGARRARARRPATGRGLFAEALLARCPHLPVEEEGRLQDARLRENFVERVFAYRRLRDLFHGRWTVGDLVRFHTAHKLVLLAHSQSALPRARAAGGRRQEGAARRPAPTRYEAAFMAALTALATPASHANVLRHMAGYFKDEPRRRLARRALGSIDDYRRASCR